MRSAEIQGLRGTLYSGAYSRDLTSRRVIEPTRSRFGSPQQHGRSWERLASKLDFLENVEDEVEEEALDNRRRGVWIPPGTSTPVASTRRNLFDVS